METLSKPMTPAKKLKLINRFIPSTCNLEENLQLIKDMGFDEGDFGKLLNGDSISVWHEIINPLDKTTHEIKYASIHIESTENHPKPTVTIDHQTIADYFKGLAEDYIATLSPADLLADNKSLRTSLRNANELIESLKENIKAQDQLIALLEKEQKRRKTEK